MTTAINTAPLPAPGAIDDFRVLPLKTLRLSKTNPRKHIDPKKQKELESSIQAKGVIVPILVRPIPDGDPDAVEQFEVVAGERRYRAAKTAKLDHVPCQIRAMLDEEALEIQVIENDQREDVHPLEQAEGYLQLQKKNDLTPEQIAAKVGKDVSWVYKRIRLTSLIEPAKKAYYADQLTLGHAELIARLQPEDQKLALKFTLKAWPAFEGEHAPQNEINPDAADFTFGYGSLDGDARTACSVSDLKDFIQQRLMLNLVHAEFDPSDAQLVAKAGACETCPKRSGFAQELFGDIAKTRDICLDRMCYAAKQNAHVEALKAKLKEKRTKFIELTADQTRPAGHPNAVKEGSSTIKIITGKPCEFARVGIYIDGANKGKVVQVCNERAKCRKHWPQVKKTAGSTGGQQSHSRPEVSYEEQERRLKMVKAKAQRRFVPIIQACLERIPTKLVPKWEESVAKMLADEIGWGIRDHAGDRFKKLSPTQIINLAVYRRSAGQVRLDYNGTITAGTFKLAKMCGVKHEAILQKIADEEKAEAQKEALKPKANPATKSKPSKPVGKKKGAKKR